jgi:hypothetical protein
VWFNNDKGGAAAYARAVMLKIILMLLEKVIPVSPAIQKTVRIARCGDNACIKRRPKQSDK